MQNVKFPVQLVDFARQFEATRAQVNSITGDISNEQFNQRPSNGGWSIGECIEHLVLTGIDYSGQIEKGIEKARENNYLYKGPYKYSWIGKKFISNVEPPAKLKFKAPKSWKPDSSLPMDKTISDYMSLQDRWIGLLNSSRELDITKVKLPSPASKLLRFSIFEMFHVNAAHQRRHLWQAENVKKSILK